MKNKMDDLILKNKFSNLSIKKLKTTKGDFFYAIYYENNVVQRCIYTIYSDAIYSGLINDETEDPLDIPEFVFELRDLLFRI